MDDVAVMPLRICLTFDVDLVGHAAGGDAIDEFVAAIPSLRSMFDRHPAWTATWFVRLDDQIAATLGKPDPAMVRGILHRHSLAPENLAMVGDRLYTDIDMARRAGVLGVLVLTGEATAAQAARHLPPPDLVVASVAELGEKLRAARNGENS